MKLATLPTGLCATCQHQQVITSTRGSMFILCQQASQNWTLPKYPILPVLSCVAYQEIVSQPSEQQAAS
jgi:hypothetical protein